MGKAGAIKKTVFATERERDDIRVARDAWREWQKTCDVSKLVFLDETSATTDLIRKYGRAKGGLRYLDDAPGGHWKTMTFIAGLRLSGMTAPWCLDAAVDGDIFKHYLQTQLAPTLNCGDIVVCDNLSSHKVAGVREIVEGTGATLLYLPPYSPDLNPIEQAFSKLKILLRKAMARSFDALCEAIARILRLFKPDECGNYISNSGYDRI